MNSEGQFFGSQRLRKLVEQHHQAGAAELADAIFREVDWFAQSAPLSDDRTLLVLKVR
jgi:serine phosphatase RsbU (regulator of sigma subunit)